MQNVTSTAICSLDISESRYM